MSVPIIHLAEHKTVESLADALKECLAVGFVYIADHGLEADAKKMFDLSERLFIHETEEEMKLAAYSENRGYVKIQQEILDPLGDPNGDFKEAFNVGILNDFPPYKTQQGNHLLPKTLRDEAKFIGDFQRKCFAICQQILEAFAHILQVPLDTFTKHQSMDEGNRTTLRLLHYPALPPGTQVKSPNRAGAHSDYGTLTILFQKDEGGDGLEILPSTEPIGSENWKPVKAIPDTLLVNIGDALEYWSGCIFKSTLHRVRLPQPLPAEGIPERYSIAFFNQPNDETVIESLVDNKLTERDIERLTLKGVKPGLAITAGEHLQARLKVTYGAA